MTLLLSFVFAHAVVVATWVVVGGALTGIGLLYRGRFTKATPGAGQLLLSFWCGYALVLFGLQVWHLFGPVSATPLVATLALGALGLVRHRQALRSWLGERPWVGSAVGLGVALVFLLWTANHATAPVTLYDSGMYHLPVVAWSKAFAAVPGIANLHGRLAFNSSGLLFAAMLDHGPLAGRAFHVANSLLLGVFGLQGALAWSRLLSKGIRSSRADVFDALLLIPAVGLLIGSEISSLDTDMPVALLLLVAAARVHRTLVTSRGAADDVERSHFAILALLLSAAVSAKLSAVVLAGALMVAALVIYRRSLSGRWFASGLALATPVAMGAVWLGRGVILSGYPLYPSSAFGFPVMWRVPVAQAQAEAAWIRMSAHELNHNRIVAGYDWVVSWAKELLTDPQFVFMVPLPIVLAVACGLALIVRRRLVRGATGALAWVVLPAIAGTLFWFFVAPHPRFGMAPVWIIAACAGATLFSTMPDDDVLRTSAARRAGQALAAAAALTVIALALAGSGGASNRRGGVRAIAGIFIPPGPDHGFHPAPKPTLVSYTTHSGLALAVPRDNNLCWTGPLLCTPHPAPNVRLRNPSDMKSGFITDDGVWSPIRWPNPWTPFLPWLACRRAKADASIASDRACIAQTAKVPTDTLARLARPYLEPDSSRGAARSGT